jgi:hypothetical protein
VTETGPRRPRKERSALFLAVRAVVNREDPVDLIAISCPEDEYDGEVEDLLMLPEPATGEQVAEVFMRSFGDLDVVVPVEMAARIAEGINDARTRSSDG